MWYCGNGYPKDMVCQPGDQSVAQDALSPDLRRCNLCRNCGVMNSHIPAVSFGNQSNTDSQAIATKQKLGEAAGAMQVCSNRNAMHPSPRAAVLTCMS